MDPATVFLLYLVGVLSLWLVGTAVPLAIETLSRVAAALPVGRRLAAVVISAALVGGVGMAKASVGPPSERMVQMADAAPQIALDTMLVIQRPTIQTTGSSYTVVNGDSLWKIARILLSADGSIADGSRISELWRAIYDMNRHVIGANPDLIHPGQVFELPGR